MPQSMIKTLRRKMRLTQKTMAHQLHISQSAYSRVENNQTALHMDMAHAIAAILHCPVETLLPDNDIAEVKSSPYLYAGNFAGTTALALLIENIIDQRIAELKQWLLKELHQ